MSLKQTGLDDRRDTVTGIPHPDSPPRLLPTLALVFALVGLGFSGVFVKWANVSGAVSGFYRMGIAAAALAIPFGFESRRCRPLSKKNQRPSARPYANADMRPADVRVHCKLDEAGLSLVRAAMTQLQLPVGARAFHRTRSVKLARTIADLVGSESILPAHVAEAIQYRPRRQN